MSIPEAKNLYKLVKSLASNILDFSYQIKSQCHSSRNEFKTTITGESLKNKYRVTRFGTTNTTVRHMFLHELIITLPPITTREL